MFKRYLLTLAFCYLMVTGIRAQSKIVDTIGNIQYAVDFYKIQSAFNNLEFTTFWVQSFFKKSDNSAPVLDSSTTTYNVHRGMMTGQIHNTRFLINSRYHIMVNDEDSAINIANAPRGTQTFQLNVFDSLFRQAHIKGFERSLINDSTYKLKVLFKPGVYYHNYEIVYSKRFLIKKISLQYADMEYDENGKPPVAGRDNIMEMNYTGYQKENFDVEIFDEGRFIRKNEYGKFTGNNAYSRYNVIGNEQVTN